MATAHDSQEASAPPSHRPEDEQEALVAYLGSYRIGHDLAGLVLRGLLPWRGRGLADRVCLRPGPNGQLRNALRNSSASPAVTRPMGRPKLGVPTTFGSRRDVICGERIDRISPASLLIAEVTGRLASDQSSSASVVGAEPSARCTSAASAVAPPRQRSAAEAGSGQTHPSSSTGSGW
jgi:hypothetical protein